MGLSSRIFLLDQNDGLYRLPSAKFDRMLRDPSSYRMLRFAAARVRMADMVVELRRRQPIRVVWSTYGFLTFREDGCFDPSTFERQQWARAELALAPMTTESDGRAIVVDAAMRFVAQGGNWTPSKSLARRISDAALDRVQYTRL